MPNLQEIIRLIESKKKSNFPWTRQQPHPQPYYTYSPSDKSWQPSTTTSSPPPPPTSTHPISTFSILSWNIDFMLPFTDRRMQVALNHLHSLISTTPSTPSIIFLNECLDSDLQLIQSQTWIQSNYTITDLTNEHWESGYYGTCTLIPKSMPITQVFRVHYEATKMERDVLCVDIALPGNNSSRTIRLCNTHLESLVADPPLRPAQIATAAQFMHDPSIHGSVIGGDFNAIQPFDLHLHTDNALHDAFLDTGGKEHSEEGYTWGQMAATKQREMFGCSRMDKLFYCGGEGEGV